jgi:hypothetical protein
LATQAATEIWILGKETLIEEEKTNKLRGP